MVSTACAVTTRRGFNVPSVPTRNPTSRRRAVGLPRRRRRRRSSAKAMPDAMARAEEDWVIYCDPPMPPPPRRVSATYSAGGFTLDDQALLARLARHTAAHKGVPVLISNHDIELTRELYRGARLDEILVKVPSAATAVVATRWLSCWRSTRPASSPNRAIIPVRRAGCRRLSEQRCPGGRCHVSDAACWYSVSRAWHRLPAMVPERRVL